MEQEGGVELGWGKVVAGCGEECGGVQQARIRPTSLAALLSWRTDAGEAQEGDREEARSGVGTWEEPAGCGTDSGNGPCEKPVLPFHLFNSCGGTAKKILVPGGTED